MNIQPHGSTVDHALEREASRPGVGDRRRKVLNLAQQFSRLALDIDGCHAKRDACSLLFLIVGIRSRFTHQVGDVHDHRVDERREARWLLERQIALICNGPQVPPRPPISTIPSDRDCPGRPREEQEQEAAVLWRSEWLSGRRR
jgi:hypothetical protein